MALENVEKFEKLLKCAGEEGIELPLEVLEGVSGGYTFYNEMSRDYEIINDATGEVMDRGYVYLDNAQTNVRYQGQSPDLLTWNQLNALRNSNKSSGGC